MKIGIGIKNKFDKDRVITLLKDYSPVKVNDDIVVKISDSNKKSDLLKIDKILTKNRISHLYTDDEVYDLIGDKESVDSMIDKVLEGIDPKELIEKNVYPDEPKWFLLLQDAMRNYPEADEEKLDSILHNIKSKLDVEKIAEKLPKWTSMALWHVYDKGKEKGIFK